MIVLVFTFLLTRGADVGLAPLELEHLGNASVGVEPLPLPHPRRRPFYLQPASFHWVFRPSMAAAGAHHASLVRPNLAEVLPPDTFVTRDDCVGQGRSCVRSVGGIPAPQ